MKIRGSFEQAICIMLMISAKNEPIKSHELSSRLDVSDSYLKKIIRQLVVHKLITSIASKHGGFILNKKTTDITFLDIFEAIEGKESFAQNTGLVEKVFATKKEVREKEKMIMDYLNSAEKEYRNKLKEITIHDVIKEGLIIT
ncbi:MAG: Rrf2 family transcriptional regulator [Longicatena sp.]